MANTYTLISTATATGGTTVSLTSIPQTYTDLMVQISARSTYSGGGAVSLAFSFNSIGTSYAGKSFQVYANNTVTANNDGIVTYSGITGGGARVVASSDAGTASTFGNSNIYIANYTSSNNKSVLIDTVTESETAGASTPAGLLLGSYIWSNSAAITSISFGLEVGSFVSPSTFYLYGIKNS